MMMNSLIKMSCSFASSSRAIALILLLLSSSLILSKSINNYFDQIAKCEQKTLEIGTLMADNFNAPINGEDWNYRLYQDLIVEKLGFAPWLTKGREETAGLTSSGKVAKDLQLRGGWVDKPISESPYAAINHKWVYMLGDSTTRQVWASYAAPFQGNHFERNAKEWTRHYCQKQAHRAHHVKGGSYPEEGWRGPCGVNEVTCHVSGYGDKGLLTFDWKHFPFEDYDEYLFGSGDGLTSPGAWVTGLPGEPTRRPDILTIQSGMHSCWHTHPEGLYSADLPDVNRTTLNRHFAGVQLLMQSVRRAIDAANKATNGQSTTQVIVITSGATYSDNGTRMDDCISRFNRLFEIEAHKAGFAVLERGEIERRLMFKSLQSELPLLTPQMHLPQPAQNIVATCLLSMIQCLTDSGVHMGNISTDFLLDNLAERTRRHRTADIKPLHSPPG